MADVTFGCQVALVVGQHGDFRALYDEMLGDCDLASSLGYDSVWVVEHHFTDYFPIPSPVVLFSHIAARHPDLGLGAAVLVTPWYQPIRLAEELAMLSVMTNGHLHMGLGRGTAKIEYDAYDVPMEESRQRFREALDVIRLGLKGDPFTYQGDIFCVSREVPLKPVARDNISLYGAIGSPQSAGINGELGLPPLSVGNFPFHLQQKILGTWHDAAEAAGHSTDVVKPIVVGCLMADTDDEAKEIARKEVPAFFDLQARHYEVDADHWKNIHGYEQFSKFFMNLKRLSKPENLDPWMEMQLFGSPDTVAERVQKYLDLGFNYIVLSAASPMMSTERRRDTLRRFATQVAPHFRASRKVAAGQAS